MGPSSPLGQALAKASGLLFAVLLSLWMPVAPAFSQEVNGRPAIGSDEDAALIAILVRSTLVALHQANVTGNYTVLRDLGAPSFQARNSAADLAASFASIRQRQIGLQAATVLQPSIEGTPVIDDDGLLRVSGTFPTQPLPIRFEMAFEVHDRVWRLIGIVVAPITEAVEEQTAGTSNTIPLPRPRPADLG